MKNKKKVAAAAGIAALAVVGGSFAYFNQTLTATNIFDTGNYDTELVEEFKPSEGENWEPGTTVNKDVTVQNVGTLPVVARVKLQETWKRKADGEIIYDYTTTEMKEMLGDSAENKMESVFQGDDSDGLTGADADDSVVYKVMNPDGGWVYNPDDGYYYYTAVLNGKDGDKVDETTKLLDSVTLAENTDMGKYVERRFYATSEVRPTDDAEWVEFATNSNAAYVSTKEMHTMVKEEQEKDITFMKSSTELESPELTGYSDADYSLIITAQTVQATKAAVMESFGLTEAQIAEFGWDLAEEDPTRTETGNGRG